MCPSLDSQVHYFPWEYETLKMIIFERRLRRACICARFALTVGAHYRVFVRLVVAAVAAIVMVVQVVCTLNVVVVVVVRKIFYACFVIDSTFVA
jgi:hypothetical protein